MRDAILMVYQRASAETRAAGAVWYALARAHAQDIANASGIPVNQACGIIAAMSPNCAWRRNVTDARAIALDRTARVGLLTSRAKARAIADGADPLAILSGPKVRAFFANMCGDYDQVTVDRWAIRVAGLPDKPVRIRAYRAIAQAYRDAAQVVGIPPAELQAVTWCEIRGSAW